MNRIMKGLVGAFALAASSFASVWAGEDLVFGPGRVSEFECSGGSAVVVGVKGLTEDYISDYDTFDAPCIVDERITDAEKASGWADDNWWCGQISELNMIYMSGWAASAGLTKTYATVDDALGYFRANPKLIRYATTPGDFTTVVEGKYGYGTTGSKFFNWFKDVTKKDLSSSTKSGTVGTTFPATLKTLLGSGDYLMQITPLFAYPDGNWRWSETVVTHAVVCCGYVVDEDETGPERLTGLFIIDSDNDQDGEAGGGAAAPNSIIYCDTYWDEDSERYLIDGLWGSTAYLYATDSYKALKVVKPTTVKITFDGNGAEDYETEIREYQTGDVYGSFPDVWREDPWSLVGWYTAKTGGAKLSEETVVPTKATTVYAQWEKPTEHTIKIVNGYVYDEEQNQKTSLSVLAGEYLTVEFDDSKIYDSKSEQTVGAFLNWTVSPEGTDLGSSFKVGDQYPSVVMPNANVTLTANYIPIVAAYVTFDATTMGSAGSADFYWSLDGGKTKNACGGSVAVPVVAGKYTVTFYALDSETGAASSEWRIPAAQTIQVAARGTYKEDGVTYYYDPEEIFETVCFVSVEGSALVTFDANGGTVSPSSQYFVDGETYFALPEPTKSGYVFNGWWTAKTGGEPVYEGDAVDLSVLGAKPTLYAQWLKAYTLTLKSAQTVTSKGFAPDLSVYGEPYESPVSIMQGEYLDISAPDTAYDANEEEYVFVKWELAKTADLGEEFDAESPSTSLVMPEADVTLTAKYRPRYVKVTVTVTGGFTTDLEGEQSAKATLYAGESASLVFDASKVTDKKSGSQVGAFQRWTWTPATVTAEDLGDDFDMFNPETTFVVPESVTSFKLTAQYVANVGGYVTYGFSAEGDADEAEFSWSPDKGKTMIPSGQSYPLASGTAAVTFYAKDAETGKDSSAWKVPTSVKLTIPKRGTYKEDGVTYYYDPAALEEQEWFVAADGAKQIAFNANGGKVSVASRWYLDGGSYYTLPTPETRKGYVFDGWDVLAKPTDLSGLVVAGDAIDFARLDAKKPTLYARWIKAYTLTLKGTGVTAYYGDVEYSGSVSVLEGGEVTLFAQESYADAKGVSYLFQSWSASSTKYDLGEGFSARSPETAIVMPAANITMTANYIKETEAAWMTLYAKYDAGETSLEPAEGDLVWSTDGKTWFPCGETVLVKKGKYTVQWKSLSGAWAGPTKTTVTLAAGDEYTNEEDPAVFTFVLAATLETCVYESGELIEGTAGGTATMNPANGQIASANKPLTLTAKAAKNYVFVGWQYAKEAEGGLYPFSSLATQKLTYFGSCAACEDAYSLVDEEDCAIHIQAVFRPLSDYTEDGVYNLFYGVSTSSSYYEPEYEDELNGAVTLRAALGNATALTLECNAQAMPLTFKVASGALPKGLKLDASTGVISGTPTVSGTYTFTVTATDPAKNACNLAVTLEVRSVYSSIAGDWRALLFDENGACGGTLEMSVTEAGKVSGKIITASGTTSVTPTVEWTEDPDDPEADGTFNIYYTKKTGNEKTGSFVYFWFYSSADELYAGYYAESWKNGETVSSAELTGTPVRSDSTWLKDDDFKAAFLNKYYTIALSAEAGEAEGYRTPSELASSGYLTVTVDKSGKVKAAGKMPDGEKLSLSTVLLPSADGTSASAILYVVPSTYKKLGSVALQLEFTDAGSVYSSVGTWVTPPVLSNWSSCCEATPDLAYQGMLSLSANGAVYSALSDLTDHYMSVSVEVPETATLEYTVTEDGEKSYLQAETALGSFSLDSEMLTGGKAGKITVGKSPSPWKDSDGYYHYDETKEDKYGETQPITNPAGLTISFKSATGIFSGKFNLFFDYETTKMEHKSVSCSYEGVVVDQGGTYLGTGSAVYSGKYTYEPGTSSAKSYTLKTSIPVTWTIE